MLLHFRPPLKYFVPFPNDFDVAVGGFDPPQRTNPMLPAMTLHAGCVLTKGGVGGIFLLTSPLPPAPISHPLHRSTHLFQFTHLMFETCESSLVAVSDRPALTLSAATAVFLAFGLRKRTTKCLKRPQELNSTLRYSVVFVAVDVILIINSFQQLGWIETVS